MKQPGRPRTKAPILTKDETRWERFQWPAEIVDVARRPTDGLLGWLRGSPLDKIIQSAYLQGVMDGAGALDAARPTGPEPEVAPDPPPA